MRHGVAPDLIWSLITTVLLTCTRLGGFRFPAVSVGQVSSLRVRGVCSFSGRESRGRCCGGGVSVPPGRLEVQLAGRPWGVRGTLGAVRTHCGVFLFPQGTEQRGQRIRRVTRWAATGGWAAAAATTAGAPRSPRARPWRTGCGGCPYGAPGVWASRTHTWSRSADAPWPWRRSAFIHELDGGHCANNHKIYAKSQPFPLNRTNDASVGSRARGLSAG